MKLIGLTGCAGVGKTQIARFLLWDHGFPSYGFSDPIKRAIERMFGFTQDRWDDREWKEKEIPWLGASPRKLAQTLGTEWGRDIIHPELWLILADQWIDQVKSLTDNLAGVVFPDMRFENEAAWLRAKGGEVWHVSRAGVEPVRAHVSERGVAMGLGDRVLRNDGDLDALRDAVARMLARELVS